MDLTGLFTLFFNIMKPCTVKHVNIDLNLITLQDNIINDMGLRGSKLYMYLDSKRCDGSLLPLVYNIKRTRSHAKYYILVPLSFQDILHQQLL